MSKINGIKLECFNSIDEFLKAISTRKNNPIMFAKSSSQKKDFSFSMSNSYEESEEIMRNGYSEGLNELKKESGKINVSAAASKKLPKVGIVGFAPHVPNAIAGIPQSMISTTTERIKSKVIDILYDCTESAGTKTSTFVKAGKNLMNLIVYLESKGYRVSLKFLVAIEEKGEEIGATIKVKDHRQPINPLKLSYMLIHPSFFRRQCFKWIETAPMMTKDFSSTYGHPLRAKYSTIESLRKHLRECNVLGESVFFTNVTESRNATGSEDLAKKMGMTIK